MRVCLLLEQWWAGEQDQAVKAAQQPMGTILHRHQPGTRAQAVLQAVSSVPSSLQRAVLYLAYTPVPLLGTVSQFALVSPLIHLKNDPKVPCPSITSLLLWQTRLRWGDSDHWAQRSSPSFKPTHLLARHVAAKCTLLKALLKLLNIHALPFSTESVVS